MLQNVYALGSQTKKFKLCQAIGVAQYMEQYARATNLFSPLLLNNLNLNSILDRTVWYAMWRLTNTFILSFSDISQKAQLRELNSFYSSSLLFFEYEAIDTNSYE